MLLLFSQTEIWDLKAKLGLNWDHFRTLVPIGTKSQIWDFIGSTGEGVKKGEGGGTGARMNGRKGHDILV